MGAQSDSAISPLLPACTSQLCLQASSWIRLLQAVRAALSSAFPQTLTLVQTQLGNKRELCFDPLVVALTPAAPGALSAYTPVQAIGVFYTDTEILFEVWGHLGGFAEWIRST